MNYSCINHTWLVHDTKVNQQLSEVDRKLRELNAFSMLTPDVDFFIRVHITKEATQSSKIERTQITTREAFQSEEQINPEKRDEWKEIQN